MELWELIAREAIRETVASYAHLVDSGRFDDVVELFTADGVLEVQGSMNRRSGTTGCARSSAASATTWPRRRPSR